MGAGWLQAVLSSPPVLPQPATSPPRPPPNLMLSSLHKGWDRPSLSHRCWVWGQGEPYREPMHPLPQSPAESLSPRATAEQDRLVWRDFRGLTEP